LYPMHACCVCNSIGYNSLLAAAWACACCCMGVCMLLHGLLLHGLLCVLVLVAERGVRWKLKSKGRFDTSALRCSQDKTVVFTALKLLSCCNETCRIGSNQPGQTCREMTKQDSIARSQFVTYIDNVLLACYNHSSVTVFLLPCLKCCLVNNTSFSHFSVKVSCSLLHGQTYQCQRCDRAWSNPMKT
jgi:hypothetical protein